MAHQTIKEIMSPNLVTLPATSTVIEAATQMKKQDIGDVIVLDENNKLCGILTDRDIAIRAVAEGRDLESTKVKDICSTDLKTLTPDSHVHEAVEMMRDQAVRRVPIVENDKPVGILSIGDLAVIRDEDSVLADISAMRSNN